MKDKSSIESGSAWYILIRIHDHVWRDRKFPLQERIASCTLISQLANSTMKEEKNGS